MSQRTPRTRSFRFVVAAAAALAVSPFATAGLLPTSVTVNPDGGNFRWTYAIVLPTDMKLQAGNYFTIYDFDGYVAGGDSSPAGWNFSAVKAGPTPERLKPTDDPTVWNLTWQYAGPTIPTGQLGLGNFWAISNFSDVKDTSFTAITNRSSDGLIDSNITDTTTPMHVAGPPSPPGVPEPGTLALAALGLPLIGLARAWRKKK